MAVISLDISLVKRTLRKEIHQKKGIIEKEDRRKTSIDRKKER